MAKTATGFQEGLAKEAAAPKAAARGKDREGACQGRKEGFGENGCEEDC